MKKLFLTTLGALFIFAISSAQVGIGTTNPAPSASLELNSTARGLLINRMTENERTNISNPSTGLLVYQTDNGKGFWYWDGTKWIRIAFIDTEGSITHNYGVLNNYNGGAKITATGQHNVWSRYDFATGPNQLLTLQNGCVTVTPGCNSKIAVGQTGIYNVIVTLCLLNACQLNALDFTIFKNGIPQPYLAAQFNVPNGCTAFGAATISSVIALSANDYLELYYKQLSPSTNSLFEISTVTFTVSRFD
jgi:hypothetical protein